MELLKGVKSMTFIILLVLYFAPAIISWLRHKQKPLRITFTNLFLGWTVIVWIVLLINALSKIYSSTEIPSRRYLAGLQISSILSLPQLKLAKEYHFSYDPKFGDFNSISRAKAIEAIKSHGNIENYDAKVTQAIKENSKRFWRNDELKVEIHVAKNITNEFKHSNPNETDKQLAESAAEELGIYHTQHNFNPFQIYVDTFKAGRATISAIKDSIAAAKQYKLNPQQYIPEYKPPKIKISWWEDIQLQNAGVVPQRIQTIVDALPSPYEVMKNYDRDAINRILGNNNQTTMPQI